MTIVALDKLTIYGASGQKAAVLEDLQQLGCMHLVNLREPHSSRADEYISRQDRQALRYLQSCPIVRRQKSSAAGVDLEQIVQQVLDIQERSAVLSAERDELLKAISQLRPWGNFVLPASEEVDGASFAFFIVPLRDVSELPEDALWHIAARDNQFAYVVVIAYEIPDSMPGTQVELDPRPLKHAGRTNREYCRRA